MIGILALQGGFEAHQKTLTRLNIPCCLVKLPRDLAGLDGLILPGGESTTMLKLLHLFDMFEPLRRFGESGAPILGTCAGAILMCKSVLSHEQKSFGWIPGNIDRNAYGSQQESFQVSLDCPVWDLHQIPVMFIRAPRFVDLGARVTILSGHGQEITGIIYRHFSAVAYHPELSEDTRFHQAWYDHFFPHDRLPA